MLLLHPLLLAIAMVVAVVVCRYFTYTDTSSTCCNQSYIIWIKNNTFGNNHSYSSFAVVVAAAVTMKIHKDSQSCSSEYWTVRDYYRSAGANQDVGCVQNMI
jgi:hypothetical protein